MAGLLTSRTASWRFSNRHRGFLLAMVLTLLCAGCTDSAAPGEVEMIWGRLGSRDGQFQKPRAMCIAPDDRIYVVDMTARVQAFTAQGEFVLSWKMPKFDTGKPTGINIDHDGNIMVADTHNFRVMIYTPNGEFIKQIGGEEGLEFGQFSLVTDCVQDSQGNYFISEYGVRDRIHKVSSDGQTVLAEYGEHGEELGNFRRPQSILMDENDHLWVADAVNHRIQVFDTTDEESGFKLVKVIGQEGDKAGDLKYPYGLDFDTEGNLLVVEFGNHRVQKFSPEGKSLGIWGTHGRQQGQTHNPWGVGCDSNGRIHVLDTYNHRLQVIRL
ncbi:MAG: SMP-30/gluconolactonase/LRE family protein [Pirellulales bacterium]|nr:SMP-30/gluconolactonase/LRE family protein [Pirellulales bacterium]